MRAVVVAFLICVLLGACSPGDPTVQLVIDASSETFGPVLRKQGQSSSLSSWGAVQQAALDQTFVLWTGAAELPADRCAHPAKQPTVLGRVQVTSRGLEFTPRLGYTANMTYTACVDGRALARAFPELWKKAPFAIQQLVFTTPAHAGQPPRVTAVWPLTYDPPTTQKTLTTVPENLLRFYVQFSESMEARWVSEKIKLINKSGEPISEAFVAIPNGLWDEDRTRLTVFLHPGRLKRGLGPRERLGAALEEGASVSLVIDGTLRSSNGQPLGQTVVVPFEVGPADRESPNPNQWRIQAPDTPTSPVTLTFDEPLDRAQLSNFASVLDESGEPVQGVSSHHPNGRSWSFSPTESWHRGPYRILAKSTVEDLAGNSPRRLFDTETVLSPPPQSTPATPEDAAADRFIELEFSPFLN